MSEQDLESTITKLENERYDNDSMLLKSWSRAAPSFAKLMRLVRVERNKAKDLTGAAAHYGVALHKDWSCLLSCQSCPVLLIYDRMRLFP